MFKKIKKLFTFYSNKNILNGSIAIKCKDMNQKRKLDLFLKENKVKNYDLKGGDVNSRIGDYVNKLHHKNTKHNTAKFHEEHKYFANVFMIFGYIRHHQHKPFDNTRTPQIREMDKMARLFKQIACC